MKNPQPQSKMADLRQHAEEALREKVVNLPELQERLTPEASLPLFHELRVHQIQLEMQNEELHRIQAELEASQARFFDLYELAPVGYVTLNAAGLIEQINLSAATLLDIPRNTPIHRPITGIILRDDQDIFHLASKKLHETGKMQSCELRMKRSNGTPVWVYATLSAAEDAAGIPELRLVLSDITERKRVEEALNAERNLLRANEAFQLDILNSLPAHIAVLDKMGTILAVNEPWILYGRENGSLDGEKTGVGSNYLNICRAASLDKDTYYKSAGAGVDAVLSGLQSRFYMEYPCNTPTHVHWFKMEVIPLAGKNGGAIVAHTDISERKQAQRLLAWEKCALESIVGTKSPSQVLENLMLGLETQLPEALCSVLILDADGIHLQLGAAPSLPPEYKYAINGIAIGTAAHENQQVIVLDIDSDPLWADYQELALKHGLHACWSTPIRSQGKILGTFSIYYHEPRSLSAADMEIIERTVNVIRIAIERQQTEGKILQLNTDLERRVEERTAELQTANASLTDFKAALDEHSLVSITDTEGIITYANNKFCEMSKYTREELLGQDHRIINSDYHPSEFFCGLWKTILSGQVWKGEIRNRDKDGKIYWVSTTIIPFLGEDGKPLQFIAIRTDISERKQAEERIGKLNAALEIRAAALESANKELDSFTYSVSHDLRAPLRAIDGFSNMVIKDHAEQLNDEGRRKLNVIRNEAHRMERLIDDLLTFSRLGRQPIKSIPIDMETMAQQVFDELSTQQPERKLRLHLQKLPPAPGSDPLIRQVWVNLISNAIKFTSNREVGEIEIGALPRDDASQTYWIKDNGVGFDMRHANKLFGVFQRLHNQEEFSGTGVGLALVQRIIIRHGGLVWAEATIDHGATFYFTLPNQTE